MTISELRADANRRAVQSIAHADPVWVDVQPAGEFLTDLPPRTVLHSGPPLPFAQLCGLHRRGAINGALLEGWAADEEDAVQQLSDGRIRVDSAMNYNTVGSGVGIVTPSVPLLIVADRRTGCRAGVFPAEGRFGGGFCGWGVYSPEIRDNLRWMRDELFAPLRPLLRTQGFPLRELFAEGVQMGDEFHSRQTAGDLLFIRKIIPFMQDGGVPADVQARLLRYFADTGRFFHNFGQASARSALLSAERIPYCTMVTAAGGNGVEYGIQVSATGRTWYTAPSPMAQRPPDRRRRRHTGDGANLHRDEPAAARPGTGFRRIAVRDRCRPCRRNRDYAGDRRRDDQQLRRLDGRRLHPNPAPLFRESRGGAGRSRDRINPTIYINGGQI